MKKFKGDPLDITFKHYGDITVAQAKICYDNVPEIIAYEFGDLFLNRHKGIYIITSKTICKNGDAYNKDMGERIARKKLMKRFMSMVKQAVKLRMRQLDTLTQELDVLYNFADGSINSIKSYLEDQ